MALFSRNKKNVEQKVEAKAKSTAGAGQNAVVTPRDLSSIIISPRVTEKAVRQNDSNVYTFVVRRDATKFTVADAVKAFYKVTPVKVNIVNKIPRQVMSRAKGRIQKQQGMKKAYVYLKKGDRIEIV
jgi:large subunit ribosomal protein L23